MSSSTTSQREDFQSSLKQLAVYTARGRELACQSIDVLDTIAKRAADEIRDRIDLLESSDLDDAQIGSYLAAQLSQVSRCISQLPHQITEEIRTLPDETFTISLFGRTKAGKSTLVSILTEGDDSIIGNGTQGTTREASTFFWEGLKVIDVPGVSATSAGGDRDAMIALREARPSDLIIFVVADDSLQKETASYLARVKALGKPVMCLVNIKVGREIKEGHEEDDVDTLCWYIDRAFANSVRLSEIREAVLAYDDEFNQRWGPMPFTFAHLMSAFLSQQMRGTPWSARLWEALRFSDAVEFISDGICRAGCFMRLKSYVNVTTGYMIEAYEETARQGVESLAQLRSLNSRIGRYEEWIEEFVNACDVRAKTLVREVCDDLKAEADAFAEDNFSDKRAGERWNGIVKNCGGEKRANKLLSELQDAATEKLRALGREISFEISFLRLKQAKGNVKPQVFIDKNLVWNRAMTATEVALGVAFVVTQAPVAATAGIVAATAHLFGGLLLNDTDHERADAVREFRRRLGEHIKTYGNQLHAQIMATVRAEIVGTRLNVFAETLRSLHEGISSLATTQLALAARLEEQISNLNQSLVREALNYEGQGYYASCIERVARIPGDSLLLVIRSNADIPVTLLDRLSKLLEYTTTIGVSYSGTIRLSTLVGSFQESGLLVEFAPTGEHLIAYNPGARSDGLTNVRLSMQLNSIIDIF